jgi:hypothetical protein
VRLGDFFFFLESRIATGRWNILSVCGVTGHHFSN